MDIFKLTRSYWDFSFSNPEKIKPIHTAIYFFAIEHCNRLAWKEKFWFPTSMAMEAIWISNYWTYKKWLYDLVEWWFIKMIEVSKNQYSSNIISLTQIVWSTDKALDKALIKNNIKHASKQDESIASIDIQDTNVPYTSLQETDTNVSSQAIVPTDNRNTEINDLLDTIKWQVEFLWFIYKKWARERERAKNILTWKDFWEVCEKAGMSRVEFCKNIIYTSTLLTFWNWKINNAETLYKHYAQVYNDAVNKKSEMERPKKFITSV